MPAGLLLIETEAPNNAMPLTAKACGFVTLQVMAGVKRIRVESGRSRRHSE